MLLTSEVESVGADLVPAGVHVARLWSVVGKGNGTQQLLCSCRSLPKIPTPPVPALKLVYESPFIGDFFKLLLLYYISTVLFVLSHKEKVLPS